ncbi:hypothetical protein GNZ12_34075 [Paraburkholderia sp. 1N]|uniref:Uncharacterized protein n=1 Tax=Paraburkholderia solitsugae TaxID=2675748 RepID=A0ABX2BZS9_9BURK|nr:hypothetical protein [Paraburkholderia solitsugae]NPT46266.1 hypothetical protein [Paraburkholderia solitsugae]
MQQPGSAALNFVGESVVKPIKYYSKNVGSLLMQPGEDPACSPNNLTPNMAQVLLGKHEKLRVVGARL